MYVKKKTKLNILNYEKRQQRQIFGANKYCDTCMQKAERNVHACECEHTKTFAGCLVFVCAGTKKHQRKLATKHTKNIKASTLPLFGSSALKLSLLHLLLSLSLANDKSVLLRSLAS